MDSTSRQAKRGNGERRLELNFLIPNVEIHSGKRLQPYYVGADFDRVDLFKQITNYKYDLYDPDDPINRRATKVAKNLPENVKELKTALEIEIALAIGEGLISDRKSLVKWLSDIGLEVTRETPKGISIKNPDDAKARPIRLTGAMYEQNFRYTEESPRITAEASERYRAEGARRFNEGCARYEILLETKSEYHRSRYRQQQQPYFEPSEPSNDRAIAADRAERSEHQEPPTAGYDGVIAATARAVHQDQNELEKVQRLKPRNSTSNQFEKVLFTSNIALISVACIALISSILFGYMAKTNLGELNQVKAELKKEKENLQETQISLEMSKSQFKQKYPELFSKR